MTFHGTNAGFAKFDVEIDIHCEKSDETKTSGGYHEDAKAFKFLIQSPSVCWQKLPAYQMVLHNFGLFYFLAFLSLGLYCTLFGMRDVKFTLQLIGFVIGFCLLFTFLSISFYGCGVTSAARTGGRRHPLLGRGHRRFRGQNQRRTAALPELPVWSANQGGSCWSPTFFSSRFHKIWW